MPNYVMYIEQNNCTYSDKESMYGLFYYTILYCYAYKTFPPD